MALPFKDLKDFKITSFKLKEKLMSYSVFNKIIEKVFEDLKHLESEIVVSNMAGINDWATGTLYPIGNEVIEGNMIYTSIISHTSGVFATDLTAGNWQLLGNVGDMTKAVYDPTSVNGDAFSMDNMVETATSKILTNVERGEIAGAEQTSEKNVAGGYAGLDGGGRISGAQLPNAVTVYRGDWNGTTNSPILANTDTLRQGDFYKVTVAGSQNFGAGSITFKVGDWVYNTGTTWEKHATGAGLIAADISDFDTEVSNNTTVADAFLKTTDDTDDITVGITNKFVTAGDLTTLSNTSGTNSGDEVAFAGTTGAAGTNDGNVPDDGTTATGNRFLRDDGTWVIPPLGGDLSAADIDTLTELNAIITDATLIDTTDSRLSDERVPTDNSVTNAKREHQPANTLVGNDTGGVAAPTYLTTAETKTMLAITAADISDVTATSGSNTGDEVQGNTTTVGIWESATLAETNAGTDTTRVITPDTLEDKTYGSFTGTIITDNSTLKTALQELETATEAALTSGDIQMTFGSDSISNFDSNSTSYETVRAFIFRGSTTLGTPSSIEAIVGNNATSGSLRIQDVTNALTIAELTGWVGVTPNIIDLGTISNVPAGAAIWEVQVLKTGGGSVQVYSTIIEF